jgi:hypothetical protein
MISFGGDRCLPTAMACAARLRSRLWISMSTWTCLPTLAPLALTCCCRLPPAGSAKGSCRHFPPRRRPPPGRS